MEGFSLAMCGYPGDLKQLNTLCKCRQWVKHTWRLRQ